MSGSAQTMSVKQFGELVGRFGRHFPKEIAPAAAQWLIDNPGEITRVFDFLLPEVRLLGPAPVPYFGGSGSASEALKEKGWFLLDEESDGWKSVDVLHHHHGFVSLGLVTFKRLMTIKVASLELDQMGFSGVDIHEALALVRTVPTGQVVVIGGWSPWIYDYSPRRCLLMDFQERRASLCTIDDALPPGTTFIISKQF